MLIVDQ
jgi:hypothetical protein